MVVSVTDRSVAETLQQVFRVKKLVGRRAPLNSNYLLLLLYCSHPYYMNPKLTAILLQTLFDSSSSFELSDLERYRAIKLIAMLFINITVFKDVCKRVSFVG